MTSLEEVYRMALRLTPDERRRLAGYLAAPLPVLTAEEILETLTHHQDALQELGVERIGLFGSYRRGEADESSDIDLLVRLRTASFYTGYQRVQQYLEDVFRRPVDLVTESGLRAEIRQTVLEEVLYLVPSTG